MEGGLGLVVLFTERCTGVVVKSNRYYKVGRFSSMFDVDNFRYYNDKIFLSSVDHTLRIIYQNTIVLLQSPSATSGVIIEGENNIGMPITLFEKHSLSKFEGSVIIENETVGIATA